MDAIMLGNIIKYYSKVSDMAMVSLKNEKRMQFRKLLTNRSLMEATKDSFEKIHRSKDADKLVSDYMKAMNGMAKKAQKEHNMILQLLKSTKDPALKQKILDNYANAGVHGFTAKNGARWNVETYSNMYTTHVNNELNRMRVIEQVKPGNKVQVSDHGTICDLCIPWEGKTLTLKQLETARRQGLFHPRCMHFVMEVT
jgi:hypothetical protein